MGEKYNFIVSAENRNREIFRVLPIYRELGKEEKIEILNIVQQWINDELNGLKEKVG